MSTAEKKSGAECRILVVDDEQNVRLLVEREIRHMGHDVSAVADATAAIAEMEAGAFDIVITDIRMPGMDGIQLTQWIKTNCPETDVIVITGHASVDTAAKALRLGAFDYLMKPFGEIDLLTSSINRAIEKRDLERRLKESTAELERTNAQLQEEVIEHKRADDERSALEHELRQAQKIEAIGRLAGGIAHDFNNLLTPIIALSGLGIDLVPETDRLHRYLQEILESAHRAAGLTHQLLAFSRRQLIDSKIIDLNRLIIDVDRILRRLISKDLELVFMPGQGLGMVKGDPCQLEQVLINLVVNARDATPADGRIVVKTDNVTLDEQHTRLHPGVSSGDYVLLSVADNGVGMADEVKERLFEPFFTTKDVGKGTGLGLSVSYGIVTQMGGHIIVDSEQGKGSTINVYLPKSEHSPSQTDVLDFSGVLPRGQETVLLVEDADVVRKATAEVLMQHGYTMMVASNGHDALWLAQEHSDENIDLLRTDVVMPLMGGRELAGQFKRIYPKTKVLYFSGYTEDFTLSEDMLEREDMFLQKPFTMEALTRKVREVLDS